MSELTTIDIDSMIMATTQHVIPTLNSPKDWYVAIGNFADSKAIWNYANPEYEEDELPESAPRTYLLYQEFKMPAHLDANVLQTWMWTKENL